jgi:hypothetical protein
MVEPLVDVKPDINKTLLNLVEVDIVEPVELWMSNTTNKSSDLLLSLVKKEIISLGFLRFVKTLC